MRCLVAIDGSDAARNALDHAADIAAAMDGSITVVHSVDPTVFEAGGSEPITGLGDADQRLTIESIDDAEDRGLDLLESAERHVSDRDVDLETELLYGDPVASVADYADGFDANQSEPICKRCARLLPDLTERCKS